MATSAAAAERAGVARSEREQLCDLMRERGALAPTLCEGWTTSDLAAHLYIRENRPFEAVGILVPALAQMTREAMDRAKRKMGFEGLLDAVRSGPPSLLRPFDAQVNLVEYFVHHEDVRRAGPDVLTPREDPTLDAALFKALSRMLWLLARKVSGVGLVLEAPLFGRVSARRGTPEVTMTGGPQELTLYLFGRKDVAEVETDGPPEAVSAIRSTRFGL
jgi:uncharacterized protein (TIGR03085 family)